MQIDKLVFRGTSPESEYSKKFIQGMLDRVSVSFHKYGYVKDAVGKVNFIKSAINCLQKYNETGNTEYLIDAGNYIQFEFMYPGIDGAFYKPTDSDGSAGQVLTNGKHIVRNVKNEELNVEQTN